MPKRLTPIERAIAGQPVDDRRDRYAANMRSKGFKRLTVMSKPEFAPLLRRLAEASRTLPNSEWERLIAEIEAIAGGTERPQRSEDAPPPRASGRRR